MLLGCWAVSGHGEELSCDKKTDELIAPLLLSCSPRHHRTPVAGLLFISSSSSSSAPLQRRSRFLRSTFHCVLVSSLWSWAAQPRASDVRIIRWYDGALSNSIEAKVQCYTCTANDIFVLAGRVLTAAAAAWLWRGFTPGMQSAVRSQIRGGDREGTSQTGSMQSRCR